MTQYQTIDKGHGRIEQRHCRAIAASALHTGIYEGLHELSQWAGISSVVCVEGSRTVGTKTTTECRYFLSSLPPQAQRLADIVRQHWRIENNLHWVLDVVFEEDQSRSRKNHSAQNLAILRRIALNLLQRHKTAKTTYKRIKSKISRNVAFRELVLNMIGNS